jgi:hypothetical protein
MTLAVHNLVMRAVPCVHVRRLLVAASRPSPVPLPAANLPSLSLDVPTTVAICSSVGGLMIAGMRDELDEYCDIPLVANKDIDPLWWWSKHAIQFPRLGQMARQFLAQPATSATCERVFNRSRRMHDAFKKGSSESTLNHALMVSMNP